MKETGVPPVQAERYYIVINVNVYHLLLVTHTPTPSLPWNMKGSKCWSRNNYCSRPFCLPSSLQNIPIHSPSHHIHIFQATSVTPTYPVNSKPKKKKKRF
ncbi:unnamed protein product [Choristocarpus tenellus]